MAAISLLLRSVVTRYPFAISARHHTLPFSRTIARAPEPSWFVLSRLNRAYGDGGVGIGVIQRIRASERVVLPHNTASAVFTWSRMRPQEHMRVSVVSLLRCYGEISKARLSMLVVTTAGFGYVMGSGEVVDWVRLAWTSAGTMMTACSANAFNQIMEIANDSRMKRTMRRPLPSGRMSLPHAVAFAFTMGVGGVATLAYQTNALTAELGAANLLLYTLVYTPLKQVHWINTWVGAVVGSIPPLLGWAAAAGQIDAGGWILGALLYFWQVPHFMALAFLCRQDYAAGRYRMLSLGDLSGRRTALAALRNCIYLVPLGFLAQDYNVVSSHLGAQMLLLSAGFGASATSFYLSPTSVTARKMFRASLLYLPIIMGAMLYQRIPNPNLKSHEDDVENEVATKLFVYTDVKGVQKPAWSLLPPIATLSAAPFPFLPAPEDRTIIQ